METRHETSSGTRFALWHLPSSTLLVTTSVRGEVVRRIETVVAEGIALDDLMLNVEHGDDGKVDQLLGPRMLTALQDSA